MCWDVGLGLAVDTRSPAAARQFCAVQLSSILADGPARDELVGDAMLVVSELVTNSIKAGCRSVTLGLTWHRHGLRIAVRDDAPGLPVAQKAGDDDGHGRGLAITASVSTGWGVDAVADFKEVWAELPVSPGLTEARSCGR